MGHLVDYEEAKTEREKAVAAIACSRAKHAKNLAWQWAETAARHARAVGIDDAEALLGDGRWPELDALQEKLSKEIGQVTYAQLLDGYMTEGIQRLIGEAGAFLAECVEDAEEAAGLPIVLFKIGQRLEACWKAEFRRLGEE